MRRKSRAGDNQLLKRLDPKWATRMPDHAFTVQHFPRPLRFIRIDVKDEGVETALIAEFRLGDEPRSLGMYGNRDLVAVDFRGRPVKPIKYQLETFRPRNSSSEKRKLLSVVPGMPGSFSINPGHIFEACDAVVALDTNSSPKLLGSDRISVLGVAIAERVALRFPKLVRIKGRYAAEFRNLIAPQEKIGWAIGLKELYASDILNPAWRVAIIVDAFVNELAAMNAGGEVVLGYTLPPNAKLVYASADTAQIYAVNKCIRMADRISTVVTDQLFRTANLNKPKNEIAGICTGARYWKIEESNGRFQMGTLIDD